MEPYTIFFIVKDRQSPGEYEAPGYRWNEREFRIRFICEQKSYKSGQVSQNIHYNILLNPFLFLGLPLYLFFFNVVWFLMLRLSIMSFNYSFHLSKYLHSLKIFVNPKRTLPILCKTKNEFIYLILMGLNSNSVPLIRPRLVISLPWLPSFVFLFY